MTTLLLITFSSAVLCGVYLLFLVFFYSISFVLDVGLFILRCRNISDTVLERISVNILT